MIIEAGVVTSLLAIKAVRQALGRLVSGAADVPTAYLESLSQAIRSDTIARKAIASAVADSATTVAKDDPALAQRGLERWTRQLRARQQAREDVAICTLGVLAEGEVPPGAAAPSEDFMRTFEDLAEKVSSAELVDLMARILAGELRKPGSVSRRILAVVPVLDQEIVGTLVKVRPYLLEGGWIHVPPSSGREWWQYFALLASVSISSEVSMRHLLEHEGSSVVRVGAKAILMKVRPSMGGWFVDGAHLTPTGQELVSLLPFDNKQVIADIARGFMEHNFVHQLFIGNATAEGDPFDMADAEEVIT